VYEINVQFQTKCGITSRYAKNFNLSVPPVTSSA